MSCQCERCESLVPISGRGCLQFVYDFSRFPSSLFMPLLVQKSAGKVFEGQAQSKTNMEP